MEEDLAGFDAAVAVLEVDAPLADRLHLGAEQRNAGLERLEEVIVVAGLAVVRHQAFRRAVRHGATSARAAASFAARRTAATMLDGSAMP